MPLYDVRCTAGCGYFDDVFCPLAALDDLRCSKCNHPVKILMSPVRTIGPTFSKPLEIKQIGRTFHSQSEFRQYQRENPDVEILSPSSSKWQKHRDTAREKVEASAKKRGFNDSEDMKRYAKKDQRAKSAPSA